MDFVRRAKRISASIGNALASTALLMSDDRTTRTMLAGYVERIRQDGRWGSGAFPSGGLGFGKPEMLAEMKRLQEACDRAMGEKRATFADVLLEELAELFAATTPEEVYAEAVQCFAVFWKLLEYLDRNTLQSRKARVYVAMPFGMAAEALRFQKELEADGFEVTSEWPVWATTKTDPPIAEAIARNRAGVRRADIVIVWNLNDRGRETLAELGTALTYGKRVLWATNEAGKGTTVSIEHPFVTRCVLTSETTLLDVERAKLLHDAHEIAMWLRIHHR
jgi:hypothetical protein